MGNLEKVLIVIILATIVVITLLAFLDSGEEPAEDLGAAVAMADADASDRGSEGGDPGGSSTGDFGRGGEPRGDANPDGPRGDPSPLTSLFEPGDGAGPRGEQGDDPLLREQEAPGFEEAGPGAASARDGTATAGEPATGADDPGAGKPGPPALSIPASDPGARRLPRVYRTRPGDTWESIARALYGETGFATALRIANSDVAKTSLVEGSELYVPDRREAEDLAGGPPESGTPRKHVVEKGETLWEISRLHYGTAQRWRDILEANADSLETDRDLRPGMELRIP